MIKDRSLIRGRGATEWEGGGRPSFTPTKGKGGTQQVLGETSKFPTLG